ncbi:MAG TPA: hypothetical protein PKK64_08410 [Saprospiraceae bacterium]|nr:hypothetical protein [Saprospiraceae bacterium]HMX87029.1 hypothetical protein [Saprospiraceae bacterium]HMZ39792.1 hypothetical protein [Saprospiraceae bacterium]HNA63524.1 hypothetical protein [Saprospiraceae bacterium]HNB30367.1 hypothetical protein [Saprospiraceae bacterium]
MSSIQSDPLRFLSLENRRQRVLSNKHFIYRMLRYLLFGGVLLGFSIGFGVTGYMYYAKLGAVDAFHMSCMILTGMGPVANMSTKGAKIFSSIYALYSGVAFLSTTAVFLAPVIHRLLHILHVRQNADE